MRLVRIMMAAAAMLTCAARAPETAPIRYSLSVAGPDSLQVEIRLRGDRDGETAIMLPDKWAGTRELWRGVSAFTAKGGAVSGEGATRIVRHKPGAKLVIRYLVSSGGDSADGAGEKARPVVHPDWFFFHGEGVFATPAGRERAPVRFRWGAVPRGWTIASDLDPLARRTGTLDQVSESVGLGGREVRLISRDIAGAELRVAVQGKWDFTAERLAERMRGIMLAEHGYWRDKPEPFLVALAPLPDAQGTSYTGTGRGDAFSILSTSGLDLDQATHTLAHEYMHHWVANLLGGLPDEEPGREFWFSEGFTEYLTGRTLLRGGIWSFDDFVADKNQALLRYATSPARAASGAEIAEKFWTDENFERISYDRGHLLAVLLDARIRAASGGRLSLDDILRAQLKAARRGGPTGATLFPRVLREVTGLDLSGELARYTVVGEPFLLPSDAFGGCVRVAVERRKVFSRGFDIDATMAAGMSIRGVDPAGTAYAAGIRNGMKLVKREAGTIGDSGQEIAYRVADEKGERVVRYMPQGRAEFDVQQIVPTIDGPAEEARCRALLGGGA